MLGVAGGMPRIALELKDGVVPVFNNPDGCHMVSENGEDILHVKAKRAIVPIFDIYGTVEGVKAAILERFEEMAKVAPDHSFQYLVVRTYQHVGLCAELGVPEYYCLGLMVRKTAIEEQMPLARSTPVLDSLVREWVPERAS
jgi:hypothetical protein